MFRLIFLPLFALFGISSAVGAASSKVPPNILWIVVDDMSAHFSCYGETAISTPHVDRLAAEGLKFNHAYVTSPVCSSCRSAMITGMYQTSIGVHHHRSGRGKHRIQLPGEVLPVPQLFRQAGYFTCIGSGVPGLDFRSMTARAPRLGKTDYNFDWDPAIYDSHDWAGREEGQPFFMQVQLHGGKLRGASPAGCKSVAAQAEKLFGSATDPYSVTLPPYYPRDPVLLEDWAAYLDSVRVTDWHVGQVIERLEKEGQLDNTLILFMTDHGISHARGKQFLYDEGAHIPFVLRGPGIKAGSVREDLVEHIDMAALSLAAAGIGVPSWMQGRDILAADYQPREAVFAARDRCGEAADYIRSVRTDEFLFVRNFYPHRPHMLPNEYKDSKAIIVRLRELHAADELDELAQSLLFAPSRPAEELYAWTRDGWQLHNLVDDPAYAGTVKEMRDRLQGWMEETGDLGPESAEVYALEIEDELATMRPDSSRFRDFKANAEIYKQWLKDGK